VKRKCISKEDCVMYVPLLDTLQVLLKNEAFLSEVSGSVTVYVLKRYCIPTSCNYTIVYHACSDSVFRLSQCFFILD